MGVGNDMVGHIVAYLNATVDATESILDNPDTDYKRLCYCCTHQAQTNVKEKTMSHLWASILSARRYFKFK
jgi:hypothetical protein